MSLSSPVHFQLLEKEFEEFHAQIPNTKEFAEISNGYFALLQQLQLSH